MAKRRIEIDIEVSKINKNKITEKNGRKFYKMTAIEVNGKYGEWMIVEKQTKEEREARKPGNILGNGKNFGWNEASSSSGNSKPAPSAEDLGF